jgi:CelD/BcsL family acetyltransferase involved in cellulose biosynthesis
MSTLTDEDKSRGIAPSSIEVCSNRGGVEIVDGLADEWRELCREVAYDQPFYHPEWIAAYIRAFLPGAKVLLITARLEGRLRLVLPLVEERGLFSGMPVRKLRAPVNSHSVRFDIVRGQNPEDDALMVATWEHLNKLPGWDMLQLDDVPEGGMVDRLALAAKASRFRTAKISMRPSPIVPVPADPELLKRMPRNSKLRSKLRQVRRELAGKQFHLYRVEMEDHEALRRFYELESSGWKGQEQSSISSDAKTQRFYDEVAKVAAHFGYLCLYMLELDGRLLAAHLGLSYRGHYYSPKIAYDESFKQWVPGHLIVSEILRDCCARGVKAYDITGPNDEWKMKWTTETQPKSTHFIFNKGLMGSLTHMLRFRVRPALRKLIKKVEK